MPDIAPLAGSPTLASLYLGRNRLKSLGAVTNLPRLVSLHAEFNPVSSVAGFQNLRGLSTLSLSHNRVSDIAPLASLRAPTYLFLDFNKIKDLAPLHAALTNDLAGPKNFAPFVNLYLHDNPFSSASKKLLAGWKKLGLRVDD